MFSTDYLSVYCSTFDLYCFFSYCFNEIRRISLFLAAVLIVVDACLDYIFIGFQEDSEKIDLFLMLI